MTGSWAGQTMPPRSSHRIAVGNIRNVSNRYQFRSRHDFRTSEQGRERGLQLNAPLAALLGRTWIGCFCFAASAA